MRAQSRWISRDCIAQFTAEGILLDRPFRHPSFKSRLRSILLIAVSLLTSGPMPTGAATERGVKGLAYEQWLPAQAEISQTKMLANISPAGTVRGVVVASPSRQEPDYYFHWIRDAALTMDVIVRNYIDSAPAEKSRWFDRINDYVDLSESNQTVWALTDLGEPKFHVDGRSYTGPWGRPQNDGPALRALTLTRFARHLLGDGQSSGQNYVRSKLYRSRLPADTVIKRDLEYVAHRWREASFDLWEEVRGDHFYTRIVQLASLREGAALADLMNDGAAADFYRRQAREIGVELARHWDKRRGVILPTLYAEGDIRYKGDLDTAVILGVLHAELEGDFSVRDDRVLATATKLEEAFTREYAVNEPQRFKDVGTAIGRYPNDRYSGRSDHHLGNPWVLTTAALAEFYFELATSLKSSKQLYVTAKSEKFWRRLMGARLMGRPVKAGLVVKQGSEEMRELSEALIQKGDLFLRRVRLHSNPDGSLSEQIDRQSGYMVSARDLTWSYASLITAYKARLRF